MPEDIASSCLEQIWKKLEGIGNKEVSGKT